MQPERAGGTTNTMATIWSCIWGRPASPSWLLILSGEQIQKNEKHKPHIFRGQEGSMTQRRGAPQSLSNPLPPGWRFPISGVIACLYASLRTPAIYLDEGGQLNGYPDGLSSWNRRLFLADSALQRPLGEPVSFGGWGYLLFGRQASRLAGRWCRTRTDEFDVPIPAYVQILLVA
jgi:hypothetical protein